MSIDQTISEEERLAGLDLDQLRELVGLVEYDAARDPFPLLGWDAVVWAVGNAIQSAHFFQSAFGMELVAYSGPTTGNRDHHAYVLKSGAVRFVVKGAVDPASELTNITAIMATASSTSHQRCLTWTSASNTPEPKAQRCR